MVKYLCAKSPPTVRRQLSEVSFFVGYSCTTSGSEACSDLEGIKIKLNKHMRAKATPLKLKLKNNEKKLVEKKVFKEST